MNVSIHLMLQFIYSSRNAFLSSSQFQYISCCSLSWEDLEEPMYAPEFQYISCCSLSTIPDALFNSVFVFQYISCCSLSAINKYKLKAQLGFNTSHVVVYLQHCVLFLILIYCFNTSHVVVYHNFTQSSNNLSLMFQYISCCSLSNNGLV